MATAVIWGGRTLGASFALLACLAVVLAPTWMAVGRDEGTWIFSVDVELWKARSDWRRFLDFHGFHPPFSVDATAVLVVVASLPGAHAASLAVRSRGPWLVLDLAVGAAVVGCWLAIEDALYSTDAGLVGVWPLIAAASLVLSAYAGSIAAVVSGRLSPARSRRVASWAIWSVWVLGLVAALIWVSWVRHPRIDDISRVYVVAVAPKGNWVALSGLARGSNATLLYETTTGRTVRVGHGEASLPVLSNAGRTAVWSVHDGGRHRLVVTDLTGVPPRPERTSILFDSSMDRVQFSPSDRLLAVSRSGVLVVVDLESDEVVHATRVAGEHTFPEVHFIDDDRVRIFVRHRAGRNEFRVAIWELEVGTGELRRIGNTEELPCANAFQVRLGTGGDLFVAYGGVYGGTVVLVDAEDGSTVATLLEYPYPHQVRAAHLHDGRIVATGREDGWTSLHVFSPDGSPIGSMRLPGTDIFLGCEIRPGVLAVGIFSDDESRWDDPTLWLADLDSGDIREVARGLAPACQLTRNRWADWSARPSPGSSATSLYYGRGRRALIRFDPDTGTREVLVGRE